jgi:hypothetical protein
MEPYQHLHPHSGYDDPPSSLPSEDQQEVQDAFQASEEYSDIPDREHYDEESAYISDQEAFSAIAETHACDICNEEFPSNNTLHAHIKGYHASETQDSVATSPELKQESFPSPSKS